MATTASDRGTYFGASNPASFSVHYASGSASLGSSAPLTYCPPITDAGYDGWSYGEPEQPTERLKRNWSSLCASNDVLSDSVHAYVENAKNRVDSVHQVQSNSFTVSINSQSWASFEVGREKWRKENPKSLLLSFYQRFSIPTPTFTWWECHGPNQVGCDPKTDASRTAKLISDNRLFLDITYAHLTNQRIYTTLRVAAVGSYQATWHAACTLALSHILFVPSTLPVGYTQAHLYAESRLLLALTTELSQQLLQKIAQVAHGNEWVNQRAKVLRNAAFRHSAGEWANLISRPSYGASKASRATHSLRQEAQESISRSPSSLSIQPALQRVDPQPCPSYDPFEPISTIEPNRPSGNGAETTFHLQNPPLADVRKSDTAEFSARLYRRYVTSLSENFEGLAPTETETRVLAEMAGFDTNNDVRLRERVIGLVESLETAPYEVEDSAVALYHLWTCRKIFVSDVLFSLPLSIFSILRYKITSNCSDASTLIKTVHMMTQLFARWPAPRELAQTLFDNDFIAHIHNLLAWIGNFETINYVSTQTMAVLARLCLIIYETTDHLPLTPLSLCPGDTAQNSLSALDKYRSTSYWIAVTFFLLEELVLKGKSASIALV